MQNSANGPQEIMQVKAETLTPISTTVTPMPAGTPLVSVDQSQTKAISSEHLEALYEQVSTGVVSINVNISEGGTNRAGTGSGFIFDQQGHIITNNHVVSGANFVVITFSDGTQAEAEIVQGNRI
jgi:S1-C subfamily serine protease